MTEDRKEGKPNADGDRNASDSPPQELVSYIADAARSGDLWQLRAFELNAKIASVLGCDGGTASRMRCAWNLTDDGLRGVVRARHNASQAELEHRVMSLASASPTPACSHGDTHARETQAAEPHPDERRRAAGDAPAPLGASHQPSPAHIEAMRRGASELVGRIEDQQRAAELHALSVVQGIQAEARAFADSYDRLYDELYDMLKARQPAGMKLSPDAEQRAKQQIKVVLQRLSGALASPSVSRQAQQNPELVEELARRFAAEHVAEQRGVWARQAPHQEPAADVAVVEAPRAPRRSPAPPDRPTMPPQAEAPPQGPLARLAELCGVPESDAARYAVLRSGGQLYRYEPTHGAYQIDAGIRDDATARVDAWHDLHRAAPNCWPYIEDENGNQKVPGHREYSTTCKPPKYAYGGPPLRLEWDGSETPTPIICELGERPAPEYSKTCDEWLSVLLGESFDAVMRYIGSRWCVLSGPCAALLMTGAGGAGKSTLARALNTMLGSKGAPLKGARYIGPSKQKFDAELVSCPVLNFDDGFPRGEGASEDLREMLTTGERDVHVKYQVRPSTLCGYTRIVITANEPDVIDFGNLGPNSITAVEQRIAHIEVSADAAGYLADLGEERYNLLEAELPAHLVWVSEQPQWSTPDNTRMGAWRSNWVRRRLKGGSRNTAVAELILDAVDAGVSALGGGVDYADGLVWIAHNVLLRWRADRLDEARRHGELDGLKSRWGVAAQIGPRALTNALKTLATVSRTRCPGSVKPDRPECYGVLIRDLNELTGRAPESPTDGFD